MGKVVRLTEGGVARLLANSDRVEEYREGDGVDGVPGAIERLRDETAGASPAGAADEGEGSEGWRRPHQLVGGGDPAGLAPVPGVERFRDSGGHLIDFCRARELAAIGELLIAEWGELGHCEELRIAYLWRRKQQAKGGKIVLGTCQKLSGMARAFLEADWAVTLNAEHCRASRLTRYQQEALVYHELSHIGPPDDEEDPDAEPVLVGHDLECFFSEVRRYGYWKADLAQAAEVFEQLRLVL